MTTVSLELEIEDCEDCPFKRRSYGRGECFYYCSYADRNFYETILWDCSKEFVEIPDWCPLELRRNK